MKAHIPRILGCLPVVLILEWGAVLPFLWCQVSPDAPVEILEPIEVTATRSAKPVKNIPNAVARIEKEDIQKGQPGLTLDESLSIPESSTILRFFGGLPPRFTETLLAELFPYLPKMVPLNPSR